MRSCLRKRWIDISFLCLVKSFKVSSITIFFTRESLPISYHNRTPMNRLIRKNITLIILLIWSWILIKRFIAYYGYIAFWWQIFDYGRFISLFVLVCFALLFLGVIKSSKYLILASGITIMLNMIPNLVVWLNAYILTREIFYIIYLVLLVVTLVFIALLFFNNQMQKEEDQILDSSNVLSDKKE